MKTKPIPVRCDEQMVRRLRRAAKSMGASNSAVVRFCVLSILPQIESGHVIIPPRRDAVMETGT